MPFFTESTACALRELARKAPLTIQINGDCMWPLLESGAYVQVISHRFYRPGDVVVVHASDGRLFAHRLIGCYPRAWKLKWLSQADTASQPDTAVFTRQIIGKIHSGQCSAHIICIPLRHRAKAVLHFLHFILSRLGIKRR